MTAQIGDSYFWNEKEYTIVATSVPMEFDPKDYGMHPQSRCTACWRGYWCDYEINDKGLFLQNFYMYNRDGNYPDLNGVSVSPVTYHKANVFKPSTGEQWVEQLEDHIGHRKYENVMLRMPYTGRILTGREFLPQYYIHMGFQRSWAYKELKEFVFEDGRLIESLDHSDTARKIREDIEKKKLNPTSPEGNNIPLFVDASFSLDYKIKAWWIKER